MINQTTQPATPVQHFVSTHFCVVNVSGGVPSAIALERAIQVFGRKRTIGVFADVKIEDPDLYRFFFFF